MRTKAEIRKFLDSQVGKKVNAKAGIYNGQCVSLIKALLEFLGVPEPYKARGNATDLANFYVPQGIAKKGDGWLRVVINHNMGLVNGIRYGHCWIDLKDEANYEQNGARALYTTKNTRPYSQRQTVINLDQWIKPEIKKKTINQLAKEVLDGKWGNGVTRERKLTQAGYDYKKVQAEVNKLLKPKAVYYTVKKGDTLTAIAKAHKTSIVSLIQLNKIKNPDLIRVGERLRIR